MRVVLDTNVLSRAAAPGSGPAREALIRCTKKPHVLLISEFILAELNRALRYTRMRDVHGLDEEGIQRHVEDVERGGVLVSLPTREAETVVFDDPADDRIVETAVAGQADALCTRDRHLHHPDVVAYCRSYGVAVIGDIELLMRLRKIAEESGES